MRGLALVDNAPQREESESVKQLEDGVARLMNGQDHQSIVLHTPAVDRERVVIEQCSSEK